MSGKSDDPVISKDYSQRRPKKRELYGHPNLVEDFVKLMEAVRDRRPEGEVDELKRAVADGLSRLS